MFYILLVFSLILMFNMFKCILIMRIYIVISYLISVNSITVYHHFYYYLLLLVLGFLLRRLR